MKDLKILMLNTRAYQTLASRFSIDFDSVKVYYEFLTDGDIDHDASDLNFRNATLAELAIAVELHKDIKELTKYYKMINAVQEYSETCCAQVIKTYTSIDDDWVDEGEDHLVVTYESFYGFPVSNVYYTKHRRGDYRVFDMLHTNTFVRGEDEMQTGFQKAVYFLSHECKEW